MAVSRGGTLQPSPILAEQLVRVERVEAAVALLQESALVNQEWVLGSAFDCK